MEPTNSPSVEVDRDIVSGRAAIDEIDRQIAFLLVRRKELSFAVQLRKRSLGFDHFDARREERIVALFDARASGAGAVIERILAWCRNDR
jgi:chorismate mutase